MSIILALFIVFLSLHSCNARVKVTRIDPHAKDQLQHSINKENDGKLKHVMSSEVDYMQKRRVENDGEKGRRRENNVVVVVRLESSSSSSSSSSSLSASSFKKHSFRVPEKKGGDEDKDFFIDYTPPRTHPPTHN